MKIDTNLSKDKIHKILVIKLRGIGDVVLSTIVIDNLREDFPHAQIDYLVEQPSYWGIKNHPKLNNVIVFNRKSLKARLKLAWAIRKEKYDLVIDFFGNPSSAQLTFVSGAYYRIGFPFRGRKYAYNLLGPSERGKYHNAILHLKVLEKFGLTSKHQNLYYLLDEDSKTFAQEYFEKTFSPKDLVMAICPTGSWASKKCDAEKFTEIALAVKAKYNCKILILWGKGDEPDAEKLRLLLKENAILAPSTTILQMAALINKCSFLIANDSGPMHISTAVGTPVLSIHGPTHPNLQGPFGNKHELINLSTLECIGCNLLDCPKNHECFLDLPLESIMNKVDSLISKNNLLAK